MRLADAYSRAASFLGNDTDLTRRHGVSLFMSGAYEPSIEIFSRFLETVPDDPDIWQMKAEALSHLQLFKASSEAYSRVIQYKPDNISLLSAHARNLFLSGELVSVLPILDRILEKDSKNEDALRFKEEIEQKLGVINTDQSILDEVFESQENDSSFLFSEARELIGSDKYNDALKIIRKVININPDDKEVWVSYAETLWITADHEAAAAAFTRALSYDENNAKAWFLKGDALQNAGRFDEAAVSHERAFSLGGDSTVGLMISKKMRYLQEKRQSAQVIH